MDFFEEFTLYNDITTASIVNDIDSFYDSIMIESMESILLEKSKDNESITTNTEGFFTKIINKIKELFNKCIEKVKKFFSSKEVDQVEEKIEELKKDPKKKRLFKKSAKMRDWERIEAMNSQALYIIDKSKETGYVMEMKKKYRAKRAKLLANTAFITTTVGACAVFILKKQQDEVNRIKKESNNITERMNKLKKSAHILAHENSDLREKNSELKRMNSIQQKVIDKNGGMDKLEKETKRMNRAVKIKSATKNMELSKEQANLAAEIAANATSDAVNKVKETVEVLRKNGVFAGAKSVKKNISEVKDNTVNTVRSAKSNKIADLTKEIKELNEYGKQSVAIKNKLMADHKSESDPKIRKNIMDNIKSIENQIADTHKKINTKKNLRTKLLKNV